MAFCISATKVEETYNYVHYALSSNNSVVLKLNKMTGIVLLNEHKNNHEAICIAVKMRQHWKEVNFPDTLNWSS